MAKEVARLIHGPAAGEKAQLCAFLARFTFQSLFAGQCVQA